MPLNLTIPDNKNKMTFVYLVTYGINKAGFCQIITKKADLRVTPQKHL